MSYLDTIARRCGTDKVLHGYLPHYERHLRPQMREISRSAESVGRRWPRKLLEIGVARGASLKMWRMWLPSTVVLGVDVDPCCSVDPGVTILDAGDPEAWTKLGPIKNLDVVIDDGSHALRHIEVAFDALWPQLRPGGWYVIEDLQFPDVWEHRGSWWLIDGLAETHTYGSLFREEQHIHFMQKDLRSPTYHTAKP